MKRGGFDRGGPGGRIRGVHHACSRCGVPIPSGDRCPECPRVREPAPTGDEELEALDESAELELAFEERLR